MKTRKIKLLILSLLTVILFSCENNVAVNKGQVSNHKEIKNILDFDSVLKCSDYSYNDNYFVTADYGCVYNPKEKNIFGNIIVYLFSKEKLEITDEEINVETKKVNDLSINEYKRNYNIFIYLIPKEFLNYSSNGDPMYYQKESYKEELYTFDAKIKKWILLDCIKINNSLEDKFEQNWRDSLIRKQLLEINKNLIKHDNATVSNETGKIKLVKNHIINDYQANDEAKKHDRWAGRYLFEKSNRDDLKTSFEIIILSLNNIMVVYSSDGGSPETYKNLKGEKMDDNKLKITFNKEYGDMGTVYLQQHENEYDISGDPISFINPGNNEFPIRKVR